MKTISRLSAALLLFALTLPAQTLDQAKSLWKARRYYDANEVFKVLEAREPKNVQYKVLWGRMYLEHWQADEAAKLFGEALEIDKDNADAYLGLALVAEETFQGKAEEMAAKALELNPKLVEAQELKARLALEDNNNAKASEEAKKALELDPNSVQGKAILASIDWLADKKETQWDPHKATAYETAGHFMTLNRRYEEAIQFFHKALELDPTLYSARSKLGINLMRLGRDQEAYTELKTCYDNNFQDQATVNSLTLIDSYRRFTTFKTDRSVLMMNKKEADLLHPYFESEILRSIKVYEDKYKIKLTQPVRVEVYPDHEDFAVRTLGMPGLGALGVTFGYSIAMDSPSGRHPGEFHWASTLWHEMSHVFTLTLTHSRVPRWFTEGLAVHEETAVDPEWGDRLSPDVILAIKDKKLLPIAQLDRGFIHPKAPSQVIVSYFQAGRICDFINEKWGWDTLLAMLHDFGNDEETVAVIRKELKVEPEEFDKRFIAYVEADTKKTVENFEEWKKKTISLNQDAKAKDWDKVIATGTAIRDLYPDFVEMGSVYEALANAYIAKGNKDAAIAEWQRYVKVGGRNPETIQSLATALEEAGKKKEAAAVLARLNFVYPMVEKAHQQLGTLLLDLGNPAGAAREFGAVVAYKPTDPARAHYDYARALRENHQNEQAKDELVAALEAAPGYRQAQKMLLEMSAAESSGTPQNPVKK